MKICLIRHGETEWNAIGKFQGREDIPLNENGIDQIRKAAKFFRESRWDVIISSPMSRAKMSAEIIREEIALSEIHEDEGFMERDLGEISGMTYEEMETTFPNGSYDGMEPLEELNARTMGALMKWVNFFSGKNIIIMTHGAVINCVLTHLSGGEIEMGKAIPKNAQITMLEKRGEKIEIVFYKMETQTDAILASDGA